jgi:hypothetical protein
VIAARVDDVVLRILEIGFKRRVFVFEFVFCIGHGMRLLVPAQGMRRVVAQAIQPAANVSRVEGFPRV